MASRASVCSSGIFNGVTGFAGTVLGGDIDGADAPDSGGAVTAARGVSSGALSVPLFPLT
ncbi:hypothetical protein GCM10023339_54410 [Alloalcanivorax gelatiniphagus]